MHRTLPLFLVANAALFALFGVVAIFVPSVLATPLDLTLPSPTALADFRAVYGGISLALAALSVLALTRAELRPAVVLALTLTLDGLAFGRLMSWALSGPGSAIIFAQLGLEVVAAAWGALLLRQATRPLMPVAQP
jgi:Domain of unknown function (DUF4345)